MEKEMDNNLFALAAADEVRGRLEKQIEELEERIEDLEDQIEELEERIKKLEKIAKYTFSKL